MLIDGTMVSVHLPANGFPADQNDVELTVTNANGVSFVNSNGDHLIARRITNSASRLTTKYYYEIRWLRAVRHSDAVGLVSEESDSVSLRFKFGIIINGFFKFMDGSTSATIFIAAIIRPSNYYQPKFIGTEEAKLKRSIRSRCN